MKKNRVMLNLIIILLTSLYSCNDWQNRPSVSDNIEDSKKRGVFICEYEANPNPIRINDSLVFTIEAAWLEKQWRFLESFNETEPMEGYQLIIITKDDVPKGLGRTWSIGIDFKHYVRLSGEKCLITDFEKLPISNKEAWKVQKGRKLLPEDEKVILGDFILYKKGNSN